MKISSKRDPERQRTRILVSNGLTIDLNQRPRREEVGLFDGRDSSVLQRDRNEPFGVSITFADGAKLETTAAQVLVRSAPDNGPVTKIDVRRDRMDVADLKTALREAEQNLGADSDQVARFLSRVEVGTADDPAVTAPIDTEVGADQGQSLQIEPVVSDDKRVVLLYAISLD